MKVLAHIFIFFCLLGCSSQTYIKKKILDFESDKNCKVIEFNFISDFAPLYSTDSAVILEKEMEDFRLKKMKTLNAELASINARIKKTEAEQKNTENPQMKKAIAYSLYQLNGLKKQQSEIISIYKNQPELTQLGWYESQIRKHKANPNRIIAYTTQASFIGKIGSLTAAKFNFEYYFDTNKREIILREDISPNYSHE